MTEWLSPAWFDEARSLADSRSIGFGMTGSVQCEITGGPDGVVTCHWVVEEGRLVGGGDGPLDRPDVELTVGWADALSMQSGELDPNVAFMQGRLKVSGSMEVTLDLLKWARSPDGQALIASIAASTQF